MRQYAWALDRIASETMHRRHVMTVSMCVPLQAHCAWVPAPALAAAATGLAAHRRAQALPAPLQAAARRRSIQLQRHAAWHTLAALMPAVLQPSDHTRQRNPLTSCQSEKCTTLQAKFVPKVPAARKKKDPAAAAAATEAGPSGSGGDEFNDLVKSVSSTCCCTKATNRSLHCCLILPVDVAMYIRSAAPTMRLGQGPYLFCCQIESNVHGLLARRRKTRKNAGQHGRRAAAEAGFRTAALRLQLWHLAAWVSRASSQVQTGHGS